MKLRHLFASAAAGAIGLLALSGAASAQEPTTVCLITKTDTNPFFVKMKEGAEAKAKELGINLQSYAGRVDGDAGPRRAQRGHELGVPAGGDAGRQGAGQHRPAGTRGLALQGLGQARAHRGVQRSAGGVDLRRRPVGLGQGQVDAREGADRHGAVDEPQLAQGEQQRVVRVPGQDGDGGAALALRLLAGGYPNRDIAATLFLAEGTVKNHVSSVLFKLGVKDRTSAVLHALRHGLLG